jgi:hypothetical protein
MLPQAVVDVALKKLGRRTTVVAGWLNSIMAFATRLAPRSWNAAIFGWAVGGMLEGAETAGPAQKEHPNAAAANPG